MDINNVKLDWAPILEGQIKHLESLYPDIPVRKSFASVIDALNSNKLKSRVILSGINVSAYAFITPSVDLTDRIYGSVGFTDPSFVTEERVDNLLTWLEDTARIQNRILMLNEIYNAEEKSDTFLESRRYKKFVRNRLTIELSGFEEQPFSPISDLKEIPVKKVKIDSYSDSEFDAFSESGDEILFNLKNRNERIGFTKGLFTGKFGAVIEPASKILAKDGKIIAAALCTDYRSLDGSKTALLVDIFVDRAYRGKGIAKKLLLFSLGALKKYGYEECALWVSTGNPARIMYDKLGFRDTETTEIFYYKKP